MCDDVLFTNELEELNNTINYIEIYIRQRNGKKCITSIEGVNNFIDDDHIKLFIKKIKKNLNCRCNINDNLIELSGDQRNNLQSLFIKWGIVKSDQIKIHGY